MNINNILENKFRLHNMIHVNSKLLEEAKELIEVIENKEPEERFMEEFSHVFLWVHSYFYIRGININYDKHIVKIRSYAIRNSCDNEMLQSLNGLINVINSGTKENHLYDAVYYLVSDIGTCLSARGLDFNYIKLMLIEETKRRFPEELEG